MESGSTRHLEAPGLAIVDSGHLRVEEIRRAMESSEQKMVVVDSLDAVKPEVLQGDLIDKFNPPFVYQLHPHRMAAVAAVAGVGGIPVSRRQEEPLRKCALPGCDVMHNHNGGYCNADHCREHLKRIKELRVQDRQSKGVSDSAGCD